ncbi:hypothetical protein OAW23_04450 [Flavobacteriales bacterium]|nr:hypothetical protein [Flavobacteriales bacterium]
MAKLLWCVLFLISFAPAHGQTATESLRNAIKEIGESLEKGFYEKSWKKEKPQWLSDLASAQDAMQLNDIVLRLDQSIADKGYQSRPTLIKKVQTFVGTSENVFLICNQLVPESIAGDLKQISLHVEQICNELNLVILKSEIQKFSQDFNNQFDQIFEDAKSIGFLKTKKGEIKSLGKSKFYSTNSKINGIAPQIILDEENNLRFCVRFSCRENVNLAKELCSLLENIIKHKVPKTYQRARDFSPEYAKSIYAFIWEFESEKFIEIAKKPTVSVGVLKESSNFLVEVRIMEPVFKR